MTTRLPEFEYCSSVQPPGADTAKIAPRELLLIDSALPGLGPWCRGAKRSMIFRATQRLFRMLERRQFMETLEMQVYLAARIRAPGGRQS
jgi:hypothetical protein